MRRKSFNYPFALGTTRPWTMSPLHRIQLAYEYRFRLKQSPRPNAIQLTMVDGRQPRPLSEDDMPLVFLSHNERRFLPAFFKYYRSMGVTRFICVDDRSTDGSREFLLKQQDADCFESDVRYREAGRGKTWREKLFHLYGYDRWYLNVDSDEFLVFESIERESVCDLSSRLLAKGIRRLPAPMIDLYPITKLDEAVFDGSDPRMPWEVATHFDGDGYLVTREKKGVNLIGGARRRVFGPNVELMKYPLIYWDRRCSLSKSIHRPLPGTFNFAPAVGCLLHFKIFSDLRENTQIAIESGQYFNGGEYYRRIQQHLDGRADIQFKYEHSVAYRGPQDLVELGFILPLAS